MTKRNLALAIAALIILALGAGYYFLKWKMPAGNTANTETATEEPSGSFFDDFFRKLKTGDNRSSQSGLTEYKDPNGTFSLRYPSSWVIRSEKGRLLTGASFTPPELLNQYAQEEQPFIKGLVVAGAESKESPENYFKSITPEGATGQAETKNLTINGYPAYMVKGSINGIHYTIYIISNDDHIVYFNYRTKEDESAHQNDIRKSIDFTPYVADFEVAVNSVKFLK